MYSVSINGTWTNDGKATKEFFESKGATVRPARTDGHYQVFIDGLMVAWIFNNRVEQIAFLKKRGFLN